MAMSQGLTLGFQGVWSEGFGLSTCLTAGAAPAWTDAAGCNSDKGLSSDFGVRFRFACRVVRGRRSVYLENELNVLLCRFAWAALGFMDSAWLGDKQPGVRI
jgi:hypothetical protein